MDKKQLVETTSQACLLFYRTQGLGAAVHCLKTMLSSLVVVKRINIIYVSRAFDSVIHLFDTLPSGRRLTVKKDSKYGLPFLDPDKSLDDLIIGDLDEYKNMLPYSLPEWQDLPFQKHKSLCRFPLYSTEEHVCLINFFSDEYEAFGMNEFECLRSACRFLGNELQDSLRLPEEFQTYAVKKNSASQSLKNCPGLIGLCRSIETVAPYDVNVLLIGETGSGKEVAANAIWELSARSKKPFIKFNCGAASPALIASTLFGHEKGAFTDASHMRRGIFELANGGTLFLDELTSMPLEMQTSLLRVLEYGEVTRIGGESPISVDVRIIAAAQNDLQEKIRKGEFREDLWYRLSTFPLEVLPLRQRKLDLMPLLKNFLGHCKEKFSLEALPPISESEKERLLAYDWPGNIRELRAVTEKSVLHWMSNGCGEHFQFVLPEKPLHLSSDEEAWPSLAEHTATYIRRVLQKTGGKMQGKGSATEILKIHYTTLRSHMINMGILLPRAQRKKNQNGEGQ